MTLRNPNGQESKATFVFTGDAQVSRIIHEILGDIGICAKPKVFVNNGEDFYIEYTFTEEYDGNVIAIGSGYIDSEEDEDY